MDYYQLSFSTCNRLSALYLFTAILSFFLFVSFYSWFHLRFCFMFVFVTVFKILIFHSPWRIFRYNKKKSWSSAHLICSLSHWLSALLFFLLVDLVCLDPAPWRITLSTVNQILRKPCLKKGTKMNRPNKMQGKKLSDVYRYHANHNGSVNLFVIGAQEKGIQTSIPEAVSDAISMTLLSFKTTNDSGSSWRVGLH